jgi:catecholate siderophore receptor
MVRDHVHSRYWTRTVAYERNYAVKPERTRQPKRNQKSKPWRSLVKATVWTTAGALATGALPAQQAPSASGSATQPGSPEGARLHFDIAPGALSSGLQAFGRATGLKIHSEIPDDKLAGLSTQGVEGQYTASEALDKLLDGTGVSGRFDAKGGIRINIRNAEVVTVSSAAIQIGLQQFSQPLLDTAQTVNVVPQYILNEQADTSLREGLHNVPGISLAAGEGGSQGDNLTIRGFTARNDIFLDGIRDFGSYYRDSFDYDAIDVLEGPAGVEFGRGSTGGVINQETKIPELDRHIGAHLQLGTNLMRRGTADINEPLGHLDGAAFRINLAGEESNVAERDFTEVRRYGVAPSLAFGLKSSTRAFLTYLHEGEGDLPDYGLPYFGSGVLHGIDRSNYYGFADGDYFRTYPNIATGRVEHDFGPRLTVRNALRFANYSRDVNITEPQINTLPIYAKVNGVVVGTCSPSAATPCFPVTTPLAALTVRRNQIDVNSVEDMLWDQAGASGHFRLFHFANDFNILVEGGRERSRPQRTTYPTNIYTSALDPDARDRIPAPTAIGVKTYVNSQSYGLGAYDTLKLLRWLQLSGGIRFDYFNTDYLSGPTHLSRLDKVPTYRAAVVVKPVPAGSLYFDYGTSFNPSAESLSLSANNAVQAPQHNTTYEGGVKWSFVQDRLNINGSWFQTSKTNVYETDPNNSLNVIPVGNQRVRGLQVGALGHLPGSFDLILGYAYLSGITTSSEQNYSPFAAFYKQGDPVFGLYPYYISARGNPFANVPRNSANLFVTHRLYYGFFGGFGFNQVSARRASSTGPIAIPESLAATPVSQIPVAFKVIPGYWSFNAMLRRPLTDHLSIQANINNLTNGFYIEQPHPNHLIPGEGINGQFGLNYSF